MTQTMPMSTERRDSNYSRQSGKIAFEDLSQRQTRQLRRMHQRAQNRLDSAIDVAISGPVKTMLPQLGATDDHSRTLLKMGYALQDMGKHIYTGSVPKKVKDARRATNRRARTARQVARR